MPPVAARQQRRGERTKEAAMARETDRESRRLPARAWVDGGAEDLAMPALAGVDNQMDELHASLVAELASGPMTLSATMEMTLVARFYERLGDHAVNIARRVTYLAGSPALTGLCLLPGNTSGSRSMLAGATKWRRSG
jgi:hypothetical protein